MKKGKESREDICFEVEHLGTIRKKMNFLVFVVMLQLYSISSKPAGNQQYLEVVDDVSIVADGVRDRPHYDYASKDIDQQNYIDESLDLEGEKNEKTIPTSKEENTYDINADRVEDRSSPHHDFLVRRINTENVGTASLNSKVQKDDETVPASEEEKRVDMKADRVENEPSSHHDFLVRRIDTKKVGTASSNHKAPKDDTIDADSSKDPADHLEAERVQNDPSSYHEFVSRHIEPQKDDDVSLESEFQRRYKKEDISVEGSVNDLEPERVKGGNENNVRYLQCQNIILKTPLVTLYSKSIY